MTYEFLSADGCPTTAASHVHVARALPGPLDDWLIASFDHTVVNVTLDADEAEVARIARLKFNHRRTEQIENIVGPCSRRLDTPNATKRGPLLHELASG
jgi:hypothetical protein